jgi:hypothetical protein
MLVVEAVQQEQPFLRQPQPNIDPSFTFIEVDLYGVASLSFIRLLRELP